MQKKKTNQSNVSVPNWMGRHPFSPEEKKVTVITSDKEVTTIYGVEGHQVSSQIYISTDKVNLSDFVIPAGNYFDPPDIHSGVECYYVLQGKAMMLHPETGRTYQIVKGDAFLIPVGVWHQGYNFTNENVKILCGIAPKIWGTNDKMGSAVTYKGKFTFYKSEEDETNLPIKWQKPHKKDYGEKELIHLPPCEWLHFIHGKKNHILVSFFVSNDLIHMGKIVIPAGKISDPEVHQGDEAVYLLEGKMTVRIYKSGNSEESISQETYQINKGEKILIPEGVKHQYLNFGTEGTEFIFVIAPKL
ncbi:MAG: cupin domain-containing protein [Candidatus Firestonebacteria bacterium]